MKVLFITYDFPYPLNSGGKVRAYNLLKYAASKDTELHLFSFTRGEVSSESITKIKEIGIQNVIVRARRKLLDPRNISVFLSQSSIFKVLYYRKKIEQELIEYIKDNNIDLVHFESYYVSFYIAEVVSRTNAKVVFGTENIEHMLYQEYVSQQNSLFLLNPLFTSQVRKIKKEEVESFKKSHIIIAVSSYEASLIEDLIQKKIPVIPNGVNVEEYSFTQKKNESLNNLLFIGNFSYFPNVDAMNYFCKKVLPNLAASTVLTIVGKSSRQSYDTLPRVRLKKYVEDIKAEYQKADLFVFPVRFGGGTNFKVLEAMAIGLPIVGFPEKIKSTGAKDGAHFIQAKTAQEFIAAIKRLQEDKKLYSAIAQNARLLIEEQYDWKKIGISLQNVWRKVYES